MNPPIPMLDQPVQIYLDLCCFNRPYDDQGQVRIRLETEAKLSLQAKVRAGTCGLIWSAALDLENSRNPYVDHLHAIAQWRALASAHVMAGPDVVAIAETLKASGVHSFDALHVASAVVGKADVFVTTDDRLLKRIGQTMGLKALLPGDALAHLEDWYEH